MTRQEVALLDVREEHAYSQGHPLFAASLPLSQVELQIYDRVPRRDTPIVVYDNGEGFAAKAVARIEALGYRNVKHLRGDLAGWRNAGFELFIDVNSASKAFGELVESRRHTPSLPAPEVKKLLDEKADVVVMDVRRFDEYQTMNIPTGVSVPGAELVLRARTLAPNPKTTIIVNCAGRTRSIIGTQSLVNAALPNPIYALRNGTMGWELEGIPLDHGSSRRFKEVSGQPLAEAQSAARAVSYRAGVKVIDRPALEALALDAARTLYCFDVRTPEEYAKAHIPGFRSAQGGQLVQETDVFAAVRGARIVLADDLGARAHMTGSWLAQMGWEVYVLQGGFDGPLITGDWKPTYADPPSVPLIDVRTLHGRLASGDVTVVDLASSPAYRKGHIPGAWFAIRSWLPNLMARLPGNGDLVFTAMNDALPRFAAAEVTAAGRSVFALDGGTPAWVTAGHTLEEGLARCLCEPVDVYRRPYEGTDSPKAAMQAYLDWEFGLVAQLERDSTHGFYVI